MAGLGIWVGQLGFLICPSVGASCLLCGVISWVRGGWCGVGCGGGRGGGCGGRCGGRCGDRCGGG